MQEDGVARRVVTGPIGRLVMVTALVASSLMFLAAPASAAGSNFHLTCGFSHEASDDPIMFPDDPGASHLHQFFGNRSTDADSTLASMRKAGTECGVSEDRSGYWAPALLDPSGRVVEPISLTAYYQAGNARGRINPYPADLRVIAGGDTDDLSVAGYMCGEGSPTSSVPLDCGTRWLKGVVVFPSCWDGERTDSANHRNHMAYLTGRGCPRSHPVRVPKLVIHIRYGIHDGTGYTLVSDEGMDMRRGMSLHADFWNVWDAGFLARTIDRCLNTREICDLD